MSEKLRAGGIPNSVGSRDGSDRIPGSAARGRRDWHGPQATGSQHSWHYIPFCSQARSITFPCSQARRQREGIRIPAGFGLGEPEKATRPDSDSLPCPAGFGFGFRDSLHSFNQAKQLQASIPYGIASVTKKIIK